MDAPSQAIWDKWRDNLTLLIALVALVQPWLVSLGRKIFKQGTIDIYETGTIEIGYSGFGPTIGLLGTLHARDRAFFIRSASLEVERESDHATHQFEWAAFRSLRIIINRPQEVAVAVPAGFMVTPGQPSRYNIFFNDLIFQQQTLAPALEVLRTAWVNALGQALGGPLAPATAAAQLSQAGAQAYPAFQNSQAHLTAFTEVNQGFYWTPGWYRLTLRVRTSRPDRTFPVSWRFQLTNPQSQALRRNVIRILQETCGQAIIGQYEFGWVQYHQP